MAKRVRRRRRARVRRRRQAVRDRDGSRPRVALPGGSPRRRYALREICSGEVSTLAPDASIDDAAALLEGFWLGLRPPMSSVGELLMIALSTAALALAFRREFGHGGEQREAH
jgi:hypothetical protein